MHQRQSKRLNQTILGLALVATAPATGAERRLVLKLLKDCPSHPYDGEIRAAARAVATVWPLPVSLIRAVIRRESNFNPLAVSPAGAVGLMQVMPYNARRLGLPPSALWNPAANVLAGSRLLAVLLRHYRGDVISALVAYDARPRRRLAPLPKNGETPSYVRAVLLSWAAFARCEDT